MKCGAPTRRLMLASLGICAWSASALSRVQAPETPLPWPDSLQTVAKEAAARGEPLVLLVSTPGCPYCEFVRRHYLAPMRKQGLAAFQISIYDRKAPLRDFAGKVSTAADVSEGYNAKLWPTLLFLNAQGQEVAERLVGVSSADFYGAYLEERLSTARAKIKPGG
jgi:thioredoxin-related protein